MAASLSKQAGFQI